MIPHDLHHFFVGQHVAAGGFSSAQPPPQFFRIADHDEADAKIVAASSRHD
jgi:hypothetical protein